MANIVLLRAYYERPNFYSAAVYISQSTGSLMFLVNLMLIVAASAGYGLQRLFYGPLRPIETEQLYDKAWLFGLDLGTGPKNIWRMAANCQWRSLRSDSLSFHPEYDVGTPDGRK